MNAVRGYYLLAAAGLGLLTYCLMAEGTFDWHWAFLPAVPGVIGLLLSWSLAPAWVMVLLGGLLAYFSRYRFLLGQQQAPPRTEDIVIAWAVLVYVGAALRLHSLTGRALPPDARREARAAARRARGRWVLPAGPTKRSPGKADVGEMVWLVALALVFAAGAFLLAFRVQYEIAPPELRLPMSRNGTDRVWRAMLCVWGLAGCLAIGHALIAAVGWLAAGRDEARVYLQDQLWSATRGEQRRIHRWAEWARLKREGR
jgi:hypothetical protein